MDKSILINQILAAMQPHLDSATQQILENVLVLQLKDCSVTAQCTEVVVSDGGYIALLKRYIATKRIEGKSEKTLIRYYEADLKMLQGIGKPIYEIDTYDLRCYLALYKERNKVSNRTLDGLRRCFSSFFSWLSAEGLIGRNPCAAIAQIKYTKTVKKPFSGPELEKLRAACVTIRNRALVEFLYATGCRVSEVVRLNQTDVDFRTGEITVLGKGDKERTVYLTDVAAMYLQDYIRTRTDSNQCLFAWDRAPYNRLSKSAIESIMRKLGEAAGVTNTHPHRYRRTLATNLLDKGAAIQDVAAILGHEDLKTTQIYCTISQRNVKSSYQKYAA